ncbi:hypothetical protein [Clostridium rectalis]|uniref:hypothetical protein n=1 Tax=Clostridium rectalis TaxID=2040295 RepID=UPI000F633F02|nr:hypothetical protein [Clostridium rectalis]
MLPWRENGYYFIINKEVNDFLKEPIKPIPLWMQGINKTNAYRLLKNIQAQLNKNIDFNQFNLFDFYSVISLTNKLCTCIKNN